MYTTQKAEYLISKGFNVSVITGFPYYPQWKIREDYNSKSYLIKEEINGVKVYRSKQYVPSNPTFFKRILHLISFSFGNFINLFRVSKPDIVIAIIPFTTSALLGWFLKIRYKSKLWIHIQDFEFDAAIDSGLLSKNKSFIIKSLLWLERSVLKKGDVVSSISNGMLAKLKPKIKTKPYYLTNWLDTSKFNNKFPQPHNYLTSNKFKILYSGNIGAKQDWDFFFTFLDKLKAFNNFEVIVVGEGAEQERVKNELKEYSFVKYYPLVPFEELFQLLTSTNLHILFQKDDVVDTVMPSKILGMMGSSKPSIITGNLHSEVKSIIEESKGGFYFNNVQLNKIIDTTLMLQKDEELCNKIGRNAKTYVAERYSKNKVLDKFIEALNRL